MITHARVVLSLLLIMAGALAAAQGPRPAAAGAVHKDLVFATVGGRPLRLDLYLPKDTSTPAPLIIHIHGGGWRQGSKNGMPPYCQKMLELGFAAASVQYRLTSEAGQWGKAPVAFPAQIHDVKGAVRWLRANAKQYNLDPERFAAWGESAGGHLTALLATSGGVKELEGDVGGNLEYSSAVQAGVDYFGPTDMLHILDDATSASTSTMRKSETPNNSIALLVGYTGTASLRDHIDDTQAPFPAVRKLLELANPITFVNAKTPPIFIGHGEQDPLVPVRQSRRLEAALRQAGVKTKMMVTPGAGHGGLSVETHRAGIQFLCEALKPEAAARVAALKLDAASPGKQNARKKKNLGQQLLQILQ